ncbi:MAG: recombinase family protein [Ruminococcus sp.]|nr:recombinase family protein [Ruminococcus sp.]
MKSIKRAAIYARFSSDNQRAESIDAQIRAINLYCKNNGYEVVKEYVDEAKTATTDRRPAFQKMIEDSAKGLFEVMIVHKLDRFARNRYDSAFYKHHLKDNGVKLISVIEQFDDSPESIMLEALTEAMAEYYSKNLSREVKKGQKETALKCKYTGGYIPYGYKINPVTKKYEVNEAEAEIVRIIFQMYVNKKGYTEILETITAMGARTRRGKPFTKNGIGDLLTNPKYIGIYCFNRKASANEDRHRNSHRLNPNQEEVIWIENGVPAIVDKHIFELAQKRKAENAYGVRSKREKEDYLLTGLIFCGECGHAFTGNRKFSGKK